MSEENNPFIRELEDLIKSVNQDKNISGIATDIIINEFDKNPEVKKNKLWVRVMLDYGKKTGEVLKRDVYNRL